MNDAKVRLVCFDWGGVILRHCRSWAQACAAAGLDVRPGIDHPDRAARRRAASQAFQRGEMPPEEFFAALGRACDGLYTRDELVRLHHAWLLDEYTGVGEVIEQLVRRDTVETALLSNTNHTHWARHMPGPGGQPADFPSAGLLNHRHASHLLGMAKPDAGIYRAFEERVGFGGADILFFDDLAENIAAAQALGWRCVQVDPFTETSPQIARALRDHGLLPD